ncbi:hypothetical protein D8674_010423 [Pyrus ussuriensis x Pyrus communis]|uniref:Uncharacterized protein n=1 Tax=Pyrus ussuriensis x Pyrus communis TaxID=2448454 RepID=A0A5N5FFZ0_9ROSA|nr:hypothetical protein D8674_010423 [Pyrus ussuriensis x Pyrus communis]
MPVANWFTLIPYSAEAGISASKWFNFRRILDMAQVFGLRPSGKCVDITHDWSSPFCPITESLGASESITRLEYNSSTFKSYGKSFASFILFAKKTFCSPSSTADRAHEHMQALGDHPQRANLDGPAMASVTLESEPKKKPQPRLVLPGLKATSQPEPSSPPARAMHLSPRQAKPSKAKVGAPASSVEQSSTPSTLPPTMLSSSVHEIPMVLKVTSSRAPQAISWASLPISPKAVATTEIPPSQAQRPAQAFRVTRILILQPKKTDVAATSTYGPSSSILTEAASSNAVFGGAGVMPHPLASMQPRPHCPN